MNQDKLSLALVQMNSVADPAINRARAVEFIDQAAKRGAELIVIPEFFNITYYFGDRDVKNMAHAETANGPSITMVREAAKRNKVHVIATLFEEERPGLNYDTSFVINPEGEIIGKYRKVHPGSMYSVETLYFRHGTRFPVFQIGAFKVGIIICYDAFFPEAARVAMLNGAELIVIPFATPKQPIWAEMMQTRAFENGVYLAPCNKVGTENGWDFTGGSMIVDPLGTIVSQFEKPVEGIVSADIFHAKVVEVRNNRPFQRCRRPEHYGPIAMQTEDIPGVPPI